MATAIGLRLIAAIGGAAPSCSRPGLQQTERATRDLNVLRGQGAEDDVRELGAHLAAYLAGHLTDSLDRATTQVQAACLLSI